MVRWVSCWTLLAVVSGSVALGQTAVTEQSIAAKLQGPFVLLRGMYAGGKIHFDAQGNLIGRAGTQPFSLGAIVIGSIHLSDAKLEIKGQRAGLLFAPGFPVDGPETASLTFIGNVTVTIARDPQHPEELDSALEKVFSAGFDDALVNEVPLYWRGWMQHQMHPELSAFCIGSGGRKVDFSAIHPRSHVTPPRLINAADPAFSDTARRNATSGTAVVGLTVNTSGQPEDVCVVRALGMGLDEEAVKAVNRFQFVPAMMNGRPVPFAIKMEVNFKIR